MMLFSPLLGLIAALGMLLVLTLPQVFQAALASALVRRFGNRAHWAVLLALPITAATTWYCFDYLTPTGGLALSNGPDWLPWHHGLTPDRYLLALAFQAPATFFAVAYAAGTARGRRTVILILALASAVVVGGVAGHYRAESQYRFL